MAARPAASASVRRAVRRWEYQSDVDLLKVRICDLDVRLEESELPARLRTLHRELRARGIALEPKGFLADEWFCPNGQTAIGIPFYLAHPRLRALEFRMMFEVEGGSRSWCMKLLRHEAGHALDHGFHLNQTQPWREAFGPPERPYHPHLYSPDPRSRNHVVNLPEHYAQAHPEEDWAETFAVWLNPASSWRVRYRGWPAMAKLEYVERVVRSLRGKPPAAPARPRLVAEARTLRSTLAAYYRRKLRLYRLDDLAFTLPDLHSIFTGRPGGADDPAARFIREHGPELVRRVAAWSGEPPAQVAHLVAELAAVAGRNGVTVGRDRERALLGLASYVSALAVRRAHTMRWRRQK